MIEVASTGESYQAVYLFEVAEIIAGHPASIAAEIVVPPDFGQHQQWGAILPLLSSRGMKIHEAGSPASVADAGHRMKKRIHF
jgi:hypothetical protein